MQSGYPKDADGGTNGDNPAKPSLSVILATKDRPGMLRKSIESVLDQTYTDFELLIVDGSKDNRSHDVVDDFMRSDARVVYMRDNSEGPSAARNIALNRARGDYVNFHDDDTLMYPEKLSMLLSGFDGEDDSTGVVYSSHLEISDNGRRRIVPGRLNKDRAPYARYLHNKLRKGCVVDSSSALIKRKCLERVGGFDEDIKAAEDWDLYLRIACDYKFKFVDRPLYTSYLREDNLRFDMKKNKAAEKIVREKTADYLKSVGSVEYLKYRLFSYYLSGFAYRLYVRVKGKAY